MTDGEQKNKPVLLKAEVPGYMAAELDKMAEEMGFSTRAKLIRHILGQYMKGPNVSFSEFEHMDPGHGDRGTPRQDVDLSQLEAVLHTLNRSMDHSAVQLNIISRQNETIHKLVDQNETLQTTLWGNGPAALPEPSQVQPEQTRPGPEVAEERTETIQDSPEVTTKGTEPEQTGAEVEQNRPEPQTEEPPQDRQPLPVGDMVEVPGVVSLGNNMGVTYSPDTVRRAIKQGILMAAPGTGTNTVPLKITTQDAQAFAEAYQKYKKLPNMPQIREGKAQE